jgi:hypothetical protein
MTVDVFFDILLPLAASKESHIKQVICVNIATCPACLYFEIATRAPRFLILILSTCGTILFGSSSFATKIAISLPLSPLKRGFS